tara:strand:+ start:419 stop:805 length:387 start_codon:yes stop_codon:yes gene_type:complete
MIIGEVQYPDATKPRTKIKCDCCELSYSNSSYKKLINNYKLLYINTYSTEVEYSYSILCHDCFFDNLNKVVKDGGLGEDGLPFFILTKETELELNFAPNDFYFSEENSGEAEVDKGHMEDFIKEILEA